VEFFEDQYSTMNKDQIATTDTFGVPIKQDFLNPNLKNTISRFVNLDSQYRQYTNAQGSTSTNYTLNLSDTLKNVLNIKLYSYQIPYSWYTFDENYGNNCFWIFDAGSSSAIPITIPAGNYNQTAFQAELNRSFLSAGFTFTLRHHFDDMGEPITLPVYFNPNSGIITLYLNGGIYRDDTGTLPTFTIDEKTQIIFYDFTSTLRTGNLCSTTHYFNNTMGWLMGFRMPFLYVNVLGNTASAVLDLNGTKYLIISLDDYNQNHVNNGLVSIAQPWNNLKIPSYYQMQNKYFE
jgi:hypothetical protein